MSEASILSKYKEASFGDFVALLKPRVMSLVVFTALVGLIVAPGGVHPVIGFASILFIAIGAGASGALNMWYDADIDAVMRRTANRPVPSGKVGAQDALAIGVTLAVMAVVMLALAANLVAAGLLAFTIFFYAVVYTMWLKRWTPHNIVIGGAAGAFPPMIGWAVVTGGVSLESGLMFALIFMWTPPHFWALALFMKDDYSRAGVPMLTVTHGCRVTRNHILAYTIFLAPVSIGLGMTSVGGPFYMASALLINLLFLKVALAIQRRPESQAEADAYKVEKSFFRLSLIYLFVSFSALLVEATLKTYGLGGW